MSVPQLVALDAVYDALQAAITSDVFAGLPLRLVRTMRPLKALETIDEDLLAIIYPMEVSSEPTSTGWDQYLVTIGVDLITSCKSDVEDEHEEERNVATIAQTICDEIRTRTTVTAGFTARVGSGLLEEATREELNVIAVSYAHTFRIMQDVT